MEKFDNVKIVCLHTLFNENALCLSNKYNIEYLVDFQPKENHFYIIFGGHERPVELLNIQLNQTFKFWYIILNSESQKSHLLRNKYYIELMKKNVVFNYSSGVAEYLLETYDIKTYSYFFFDFMMSNLEEERIYDYVFIGSPNENRLKLIDELKQSFPGKNIYVDFEGKYQSASSMKHLLSKTKWLLNIPFYENDSNLETHRIHNGLSCGCQVVSFKSGDTDTDTFYNDYIYFTDNLVDFFKSHEVKEKKKYTDLIRGLSAKWGTHNLFIINKMIDKLSRPQHH